MNVALINKKTNICENVAVFESLDIAGYMFSDIYFIIQTQDRYGIGDICRDGKWSHELVEELTQEQKREQAYETMLLKEDGKPLLLWQNEAITIDAANKKWLDYSAEGSTVANELSALIVSVKAYIRGLYPDVNA